MATPHGLAAPRSTSSSSTVLTSFLLGRVDDRQGVGVHPAAFQLRGRHLVAGEDVGDVGVLAVGRDADARARSCCRWAGGSRSVWLVAVSITVTIGRHVVGVGRDRSAGGWSRTPILPSGVIAAAIGSRIAGTRAISFLRRQVDHRHVVVEAVADVEPLAVGADAPARWPCGRPAIDAADLAAAESITAHACSAARRR